MDFAFSAQELHWQRIAHDFAQNEVAPIAREMDESGTMPLSLIDRMAELGLLGATISKQYNGSEMNAQSLALVYEELGRVCSSTRGFMTVHSSLVMQCLNQWGSEEQKKKYLPQLVSGKLIGCYGLTEAEAGSDAGSIQTTATPTDGGYKLNGRKIWITNGGIASFGIVFAKLPASDGEKPHSAITAFIIDPSAKGFTREPMPGKELGHRASDHAQLIFNDWFVSSDAVLGGERNGFKVAMSALDHGRLGVAAGALGVHQACLDACIDFVRTRKQFGSRLGDFEMIQAQIADMKISLEASRNLVYKAAWKRDSGESGSLEASTAKLFATEAAVKAASDAVLIHGGRGYSNEYPVERYYRDIKGLQIYEGTSHIQRIVIARHVIGKP
ncbi:MAG TPA: acyl-CoA dehydrogenase family protein [Candidatus Kapabacteria bacterium]|nr:acyl-CoA dehydrogenase family protein [Candidatus Kapabacteria bacterium]